MPVTTRGISNYRSLLTNSTVLYSPRWLTCGTASKDVAVEVESVKPFQQVEFDPHQAADLASVSRTEHL